jgi:Carboxypeptidase regulatory-like domain
MRSRFVLFVLAETLAVGCGGQAPTTPTPAATPSTNQAPTPSPRVAQSLHIAGRVVDTANAPVAGARVTQWDTASTAGTDANGAFELTASVTPQDRSFWVTVEKPGFETSELARSIDVAANTSLRLHEIRTIAAGQSFQAAVNADDSACGYHWGYVCRRVHVTAPASGTLIAEVSSDRSDVGVTIVSGPVGFPQLLERRTTVAVKAGTEVAIDISTQSDTPAAASFSLNTALVP